MGNKKRQESRGKPKKKSVKSRADLGSKRRLSRFGKEQKKGHKGEAASYLSRTRAIKNLQITLRDFRCVLAQRASTRRRGRQLHPALRCAPSRLARVGWHPIQ